MRYFASMVSVALDSTGFALWWVGGCSLEYPDEPFPFSVLQPLSVAWIKSAAQNNLKVTEQASLSSTMELSRCRSCGNTFLSTLICPSLCRGQSAGGIVPRRKLRD